MPPPLASQGYAEALAPQPISPESPPLVTLALGPDGAELPCGQWRAVAGKSRAAGWGLRRRSCAGPHASEEVRTVPVPSLAVKWRGHRRGSHT